LDGTVTQYGPEGSDAEPQVFREQVWIDLPTSRFRLLIGTAEGSAEEFKACDGGTVLDMDLKTGQSQSYPLPEFAQVKQFVPTLEPGHAYPQPLWGQMGTQLSQLAFTSDFAQSEGTFKPVATELVAKRETIAVEWAFAQNELPSWRMWLDIETAVILKMQTFGKGGGETIQTEAVVKQLVYDENFADALFRAPASLPQFGDITGQASGTVEAGSNAPSGRDTLGELYFFTLPHQTGQSVQLVRLPGLCVVGLAACPQLEAVKPPFPFNFSLTALSWSPDGDLAAFAYPDNPNGTPYKLWLFDPAAETWISLFEYAHIDPPFWSPDGDWIAFRVQNGSGGEEVYVIRRDGSGLKNLTFESTLPIEGRPYVMDGWITGNIIVRSARPGKEGTVYLIRVADGRVQPMFETLLTKSVFVPSGNGAWLAYDDYNYDSQKHTLFVMEPDGANPIELTSFSGGTLYPIVYQGVTVGGVMFSPDGQYLLINETNSPTGVQLFVVDLETLDQRIIQAPGLSLDTDWSMPSWRN
jgi:hypothetical protein